MALDWQPIAVVIGAVATALGAVITGVQTGRNSRSKDANQHELDLRNARLARDTAEEVASRTRIEAIAADAAEMRTRLRETERENEERLREMRTDLLRGWDLARYHFGLVGVLAHLVNNVLQAAQSVRGDPPPERVLGAVREMEDRMRKIKVPLSVEEPIPLPAPSFKSSGKH